MKIIDQFHTCHMLSETAGIWQLRCHLRIFKSHTNVHTVMIADMGFEVGWFNPCVIEQLVNQIVHKFELDPAKLIWLEHYAADDRAFSPAAFSQVVFTWQNGKATNPQWLSIAPEVAYALIHEDLRQRSA